MRKMPDPLFGASAFGDIFMGGNPSAVRQRLVGNLDRASVGGFDGHDLSEPYVAQDKGAVCVEIAHERAGRFSMSNDLAEGAARFHDLCRQSVHLDIALVANDQPLRRIE